MPLYEYECPTCGGRVEAQRAMADRHDGPACAACDCPTELVVSAPLSVFKGQGWTSPTTVDKLRRRNAEHTARGHQLAPRGHRIWPTR